MPILISRTYSVTTPESAMNGEAEEQGFMYEDSPVTFRELVDQLKFAYSFSSCPVRGSIREWATVTQEMHFDGSSREECLHYSHNNKPRQEKYWRKALVAAGAIRE